MAEPVPFTYRAFLSYSHRDSKWVAWLHRALENTKIDKDLVGRPTPVGPVPASLRPIFRDRDDFTAGHSLTDQTMAALQGSQFLIAICSPNAARSAYVNEEIRAFKAMGRGDRVIPLIIDGEPGDGERECFPPAVRFKLDADGTIGTEREEPIAADARPQGDGKRMALVKITAGLLGVRLDEVIRRAERARARHRRIWLGVAGAFAILLAAGTGGIAWGYNKSLENDGLMDEIVRVATGFVSDATDMSERLGIPVDVPLALLTRADSALSGYIAKGKDSPKLRHRRAMTLLDLADNYAKLGQTAPRMQRTVEARALLERLVETDERNPNFRYSLATAYTQVADVMLAQGAPPAEVLAQYRKGQELREGLLKGNPDHVGILSELSISYERIADLLMSQHNLAEASETVARLVKLRERLAKDRPDLYEQRNLAIAYSRAGDIAFQRGMTDEALRLHRQVLAIDEKLVAAAPNNTTYLRDLAIARNTMSLMLVSIADTDGAIAEAKTALDIRKRLASSDPSNAIWQLDLATSHESLGNLYRVKSEWSQSLEEFRAAYAIRQKLAAADPKNVDTVRALSIARGGVAAALVAVGNTEEALALYRENLAVREKLAADSPTTVQWQLDVAQVHWAIGDLLVKRKAFADALQQYQKGRAIIAAKADPANVTLQRQLGYFDLKIAEVYQAQGESRQAIEAYRRCLAIRLPLAAANPGTAALALDVVFARWPLADLGDEPLTQLTEIVATLRRLRDDGLLAPVFAPLLPNAERQLASLKS